MSEPVHPKSGRWILLPVLLYLATWLTTTLAGGLVFSACLMTILTCHELGHFFQTLRYRVSASFPYFIPLYIPFMPFQIGTMGAVIGMNSSIPNRRALFDIGISGPIAGLIPTLVFCFLGLQTSHIATKVPSMFELGDPLIMQWMVYMIYGPLPDKMTIYISPMGFAGWVGLLITSLNLIPIGQLDGGHVFYALVRERAAKISRIIWFSILIFGTLFKFWNLIILTSLIYFLGPVHPPTRNDGEKLGWARTIFGWTMIAFLLIGLAPRPIIVHEEEPEFDVPVFYVENDNHSAITGFGS